MNEMASLLDLRNGERTKHLPSLFSRFDDTLSASGDYQSKIVSHLSLATAEFKSAPENRIKN
jgi:hypothetical protein